MLNAYARPAGVELAYRAELTASVSSLGLKGRYGLAEGLSRILAGTGITYRQTGSRGFTLEPAPTADAGAVQLSPVRVDGGSDTAGSQGVLTGSQRVLNSVDAVTERTKSYTTNAVTIGKTVLNPRDIPQSVSVVTRQRIEDQNLFTVDDALLQAPGITVKKRR